MHDAFMSLRRINNTYLPTWLKSIAPMIDFAILFTYLTRLKIIK